MPLKASCLHVRLENLRIWDEMLTVVVDRAGTRSKKIKSLYMFKQRTSSSHRLKREEGERLGNLASFVPSFFLLNKIWSGPHSFFLLHPYQQHWTTSNQGGCNYYMVWAYKNNSNKNVQAPSKISLNWQEKDRVQFRDGSVLFYREHSQNKTFLAISWSFWADSILSLPITKGQ